MRSSLLIAASLFAVILFSASFRISETNFSAFAFLGGGTPVLPETPYSYGHEEMPLYFTGPLVANDFYENIDSNAMQGITNEGATLGRVLFYDEILSVNENVSCATCHKQSLSFADNVPFSTGTIGPSAKNVPQLNDLAWSNNTAFTWNMGKSNLADAIRIPLQHPNELGAGDISEIIAKINQQPYYANLFEAAFGDAFINEGRIVNALGQFIKSMTTFNTRLDRILNIEENYQGSSEKQGSILFAQHCASCHKSGNSGIPALFTGQPEMFLDFSPQQFENFLPLAADDLGAGEWDEFFSGFFKVPTLRNIEHTAPYMHDGRFETLEEVVEHYSTGIPEDANDDFATGWTTLIPDGGFQFSSFDKVNLVAFLSTLTDDKFLNDIRFSDPFGSTTQTENNSLAITTSKVYPNPTTGPLHIEFDNYGQQNVFVYLLNIEGKLVRKLSSHKSGLSTDLSNLEKGAYIVRVMTGKDIWEDHKLVVQ